MVKYGIEPEPRDLRTARCQTWLARTLCVVAAILFLAVIVALLSDPPPFPRPSDTFDGILEDR